MPRPNRNTPRAILSLVILGSLCLDWSLWRSVSSIRRKIDASTDQVLVLNRQLDTENKLLEAMKAATADRLRAFTALSKSLPPDRQRMVRMLRMIAADRAKFGPSDPIRLGPGYYSSGHGMHGELMLNDSYARSQRAVVRYELESTYAALLPKFAASGIDTAHLLDLATDWRTAGEEARAIALSQGSTWKLANQASDEASASVQKEIEDFLGPENFATYQAFGPGQFVTDQVVDRMSFSGTSLTPDQYVNLAILIGKGNDPRGALEGTVTSDIIASARGLLSPDQLQALQTFEVDYGK